MTTTDSGRVPSEPGSREPSQQAVSALRASIPSREIRTASDILADMATEKLAELRETRDRLCEVLRECEAYFEERADAETFHDGAVGNDEMTLLCQIREVLRRAK